MTAEQKELKNKLAQEAFDYYVFNERFDDNRILRRLYAGGFCKSLAMKALEQIKRLVLKEYNK